MRRTFTRILAVGSLSLLLLVSVVSSATIRVPGDQPTIQDGIDAAFNRDTVLVADGTYTGEGNKNLDYLGKRIAVLSESGPEFTIIDCKKEGRGFCFQGEEDSLSILDGFTIRNGYVTGGWPDGSGGAIRCLESSPTILNCILTNNEADGTGGIFAYNTNSIVIGCYLYWNKGVGTGGIRGSSRVIDCEISENTGCGISDATIINNCYIHDNYNPDRSGGGISSSDRMANCVVRSNTARDGGGIAGINFATKCVIIENNGGGVCSGGELTDCIIAGNTGSGVYSTGYPDLTNCTIVGNSGCGVKCIGSYAYATIVNCIVWENSGDEISDWNGWTQVDYSDVQGAIWPGTGNIMANPQFVDPRNGDFRLLPESPCIDAGDPSFTPRTGGGHRIDMGAIEHFLGFNFE